ncbi:MAG: SOS response-associated peptidase [Flavobacteriaceae bacterium]|nr:SOS response-associated peptidase [Bacteroidia bacterium]NNL15719.1 SOS response-associated peptidase [Flavobacteriaceae bacterium]
MCYQTQLLRSVSELELRYNVGLDNEQHRTLFNKPQFHLNGFAHPNMLVIPQNKPEVLAPGIWGIVPENKQPNQIKGYYKEAVKYGAGLNAKSEKLFDHFIYKNVSLTQRCIIPVTGFFEPHSYQKKKYPYYIRRKDDKTMSLAGIYTVIGTYLTFSILTKKASPLFEKIHNIKKRQPVILNLESEKKWLDNSLSEDTVYEIVMQPYNDNFLETYTVSKDLYNPRIDSNVETIKEKVIYPELESSTLF